MDPWYWSGDRRRSSPTLSRVGPLPVPRPARRLRASEAVQATSPRLHHSSRDDSHPQRSAAALRWRQLVGPLAAFAVPFALFYFLAPYFEAWVDGALRDMFTRDAGFLPQIVARVPVMFIFTLLAVRLGGKRHVSDMGPFDFVITLAAASAVGDAVLYQHVPLSHAIVVIGALFFLRFVLTTLTVGRPATKNALEGTPTVLIEDGRVFDEALARERIDRDTLAAALRKAGTLDADRVALASLERDGSISVVNRDNS
jgi:hypothetical protein